jgi:hypothetical protein
MAREDVLAELDKFRVKPRETAPIQRNTIEQLEEFGRSRKVAPVEPGFIAGEFEGLPFEARALTNISGVIGVRTESFISRNRMVEGVRVILSRDDPALKAAVSEILGRIPHKFEIIEIRRPLVLAPVPVAAENALRDRPLTEKAGEVVGAGIGTVERGGRRFVRGAKRGRTRALRGTSTWTMTAAENEMEEPAFPEERRRAFKVDVLPGLVDVFTRNFQRGMPAFSRVFGQVEVDEIALFGLTSEDAGYAVDQDGRVVLVAFGPEPSSTLLIQGPYSESQDEPIDLPDAGAERRALLGRLGLEADATSRRTVAREPPAVGGVVMIPLLPWEAVITRGVQSLSPLAVFDVAQAALQYLDPPRVDFLIAGPDEVELKYEDEGRTVRVRLPSLPQKVYVKIDDFETREALAESFGRAVKSQFVATFLLPEEY